MEESGFLGYQRKLLSVGIDVDIGNIPATFKVELGDTLLLRSWLKPTEPPMLDSDCISVPVPALKRPTASESDEANELR